MLGSVCGSAPSCCPHPTPAQLSSSAPAPHPVLPGAREGMWDCTASHGSIASLLSHLPSSCLHFLLPGSIPSPPAGPFPGNADESTHLHLCVPALCSPWLPPSIPSCIPVSPQPASPCQPHPFLSTSRVIQNPLESTEHFLWPSRTLDQLLDKLRSSLEPPLYIKLFLALASVVSHTPKLNYPPFSQLPALNILLSGVLLKEMIQWLL